MPSVPHSRLLAIAAAATLAGCATPPPAGTATTAAGTAPAASPARICRVEGLRFVKGQGSVSPTMTVSQNGSCPGHVQISSSAVLGLTLTTPPQHGRVAVDDTASPRPGYRYTPARGYTGPDRFTLLLNTGTGVRIDMAVDVLP